MAAVAAAATGASEGRPGDLSVTGRRDRPAGVALRAAHCIPAGPAGPAGTAVTRGRVRPVRPGPAQAGDGPAVNEGRVKRHRPAGIEDAAAAGRPAGPAGCSVAAER